MISIRLRTGTGDKEAQSVSDTMITNTGMAIIRGKQELWEYSRIRKTRTLRIPHDPTVELDQMKPLSVGYIGISGDHRIDAYSLEITPTSIYQNVTITQWQELEQ